MRRFSFALLMLIFAAAALSWFAGSRLVAPIRHPVPLPAGLAARKVALALEEGRTLAGWFLPGKGKGAILLLHGIRGDRRQMLGRARFLNAAGYGVLLVDLPGHGESAAPVITFGLREADGVRAALAYLEREAPAQPLGVIGVSLGAASFMLCRDCLAVDAVVLESMYPTIHEAVEDRLRMRVGPLAVPLSTLLLAQLPLRLDILPAQLRPIDAMAGLTAPVLVAAGDQDRHTTIAETRRIVAAAPAPRESWEVPGAAHVDLYGYARQEYEARIGGFPARGLHSAMRVRAD
ncbi:alpha/beta hydrolase [Massilia sp. Se16.2.3]|uniref:alpha/beta hydrolase n=1 Tax=Massilia sp. Se16.2.3 TaxID=2709303 RepID=UPI0015FF3A1E|nr:alpha/beta fold hydrolase [Massilia sp. Se16.2.3]QNA98729.1 alpha/beta fold hydrolase [Massilia sp. Se16.2.3]